MNSLETRKRMSLMKKWIYLLVCAALLPSCQGFLDVVPENSQVSDDYWNTEQDVETMLAGGYYYLRSAVVDYLIPWGEGRAGLVYNTKSNNALQSWQIQSNSSLCDWSVFYKIINLANTVLERADEACANDDTYSEAARNSHYTEAYFLRALSYFYLVRNFRDVPLTLKAYEDDNVEINLAKSSEEEVVAQIKNDILTALETGAAKESFQTTWETKGRATKWALYALMCDVCLWSGDYAGCIQYAEAILQANSAKAPSFLSTPSRATYMSIFNPGNSNESIFELQWNYEEDQTNALPELFDDQNDNAAYAVSPEACNDFVREYLAIVGDGEELITKESPRTYHSSFFPATGDGMAIGMTKGYVWKYVGSTTEDKKRTVTYYDPNFIIYRVADVILMEAEAYLLLDGTEPTAEHKLAAVRLINRIRERAGLEDNIAAGLSEEEALAEMSLYPQENLLDKVLDERKIEFLGEGKIWYDFLRLGRCLQGKYKNDFLVEQVVSYNTCASESWIRSVLTSDNALFMPVNETDIERNPQLIQNPYYN